MIDKLPPLEDDERFAYKECRDDGELWAVEFHITKGAFEIKKMVMLDQAYYAKFDLLRTTIEEMLEEIRAA
jgi:hypothetical protein